VGKLMERLLGLASTAILARLLVPADFGVVAMGTTVVAAVELLGAFGFDLALIQNPRARRLHYDTVWTFNVLLGIATAVVLIGSAGVAAAYYDEPRLHDVMGLLALCSMTDGFTNVGIVAFRKEIDFRREFRLQFTRKLVGFLSVVTLAYTLQSYWALLLGVLASKVSGVLVSYLMHPYRPRFSLAGASELFDFSKWVLVNNLLLFVSNRGADLVVGRVAGVRALGLYSVAYEIANLPTTELLFPVSRAIFPGYAKLAGDRSALVSSFLSVFSLIVVVAVPAGLGIVVLSDVLVGVVLGSQWRDAAPVLQILALYGVMRAGAASTGPVYLALGMPRVIASLTSLNIVLMFAVMVPLMNAYGPFGVALSVLAASTLQVPVNFWTLRRRLGLGWGVLGARVWRPLAAAAGMALTLAPAEGWLVAAQQPPVLRLSILLPAGVLLYTGLVLVLWRGCGSPDGAEATILGHVRTRLPELRVRSRLG
jgi:O-antigen/teichoic acid export membrane protein